ncbi:MAG TPA: hypothetical protein VGE35_01675 [Candidatus Paceibacterota bacterium]
MKKIHTSQIGFTSNRPECAQENPINIYFEGQKPIERGVVVEKDGSKGLVYDLRHDERAHPSEKMWISVYWFRGPLSNDEEKRKVEYNFEQFLLLLGWELDYEGKE